jgi:hypothetical protein
MRLLTIEKWKWRHGGRELAASWPAIPLGADSFGDWTFCPAGTPYRKADGQTTPMPSAGVQLFPDAHWTAWWWADRHWIAADVCTPPTRERDRRSYLDLEIDVIRLADGTVQVLDEDEFEQLAAAPGITRDVTDQARLTSDWLAAALKAQEDPFGTAGWTKFAEALDSA